MGMVTTFCHHDQAKMEASEALAALQQCDLPELSIMVVRRYVNTPYIPKGTTQSLYLDMSILSTQFPLESLCL